VHALAQTISARDKRPYLDVLYELLLGGGK
jgi:hypothetical protein